MPNLKTDRTAGVAWRAAALNVRRLMYQSLIWPVVLGDEARSLGTPLHAQHMQRAANPLIDRMRGNTELDGYFLGRQMLIYEEQAIELPLA